MALKESLWGLLFSDFITIGIIIATAFAPRLSVFTRKILFNSALYSTSVALLYYLGSNGPGLLYLLAITIFILLSLDKRFGYVAVALNTIICIGFCIAIYYGFASPVLLNEYQFDSWIGVSSNLIFLSAVSALLIPRLFNGLQSAIDKQNHLGEELEKSVTDLNAKNKELEQFTYTISHDLKEPLRMVHSFMKLLKNKYRKQLDEKAHEYIYYAMDGAQRMQANIDDLLEYSRIGRKYTSVEHTDLNALLDIAIQNLQADIQEQQTNITPADLPTLNVVPVALKILFQNLLSNALKYQQDDNQPNIEISAEEESTSWLFSFSDNGIGIDPEYHEQIFSIFKRLHPREEIPGNGMGLAICKKIVEQHGGKIWVESKSQQGSTFYFTISKHYFDKNDEKRGKNHLQD